MQIAIENPVRKLIMLYFHSRDLVTHSKQDTRPLLNREDKYIIYKYIEMHTQHT